MPKKTFFNLPDEKKLRIIEATYDEFIEKPYEKVNIRSITSRANINIASFYQYFIDKDDLYLYLLSNIAAKIGAKGKEEFGSFFFDDKDLDLYKVCTEKEILYDRTWYNVPVDVMRKFYFGDYNTQIKEMYRQELLELQEKGILDDSIDLEFVLHVVVTIMFNILMYFREYDVTEKSEKIRITNLFYNHLLPYGIVKNAREETTEPNLSLKK